MADMPHLLKSVRNCLYGNSILTCTGTASWEGIKKVHEIDKRQALRLCPRLKDQHFNLHVYGAKMKVIFNLVISDVIDCRTTLCS